MAELKGNVECEVDGIKYSWFPDRFYLDEPNINSHETKDSSVRPCFNRRALIKSLISQNMLKAVIFETYSLRLAQLKKEFPTLFKTASLASPQSSYSSLSPCNDIPVLILHGDKKVPIPEEQDKHDIRLNKRRYRCNNQSPKHSDDDEDDDECDCTCASKYYRTEEEIELPSSTVVLQIQPTLLEKYEKRGRVGSMGVFHPKLMLLFCIDKLIVVISSANLTSRGHTVEGSWVQQFPKLYPLPCTVPTDAVQVNDFGRVLFDFLKHQSDDVRGLGGMSSRVGISDQWASFLIKHQPLEWIIKHSLINPIGERQEDVEKDEVTVQNKDDLNMPRRHNQTHHQNDNCLLRRWLNTYDFSTAVVDLVTTVPGIFRIPNHLFNHCDKYDKDDKDDGSQTRQRAEKYDGMNDYKGCCCGDLHCDWSRTSSRDSSSSSPLRIMPLEASSWTQPLQYGQFRISQLLANHSKPDSKQHQMANSSYNDVIQMDRSRKNDKKRKKSSGLVLVQPTSIGSHMNSVYLTNLLTHWQYDHTQEHNQALPQGVVDNTDDDDDDELELEDKLRVVWPPARTLIGGASFFSPAQYDDMGVEAQACLSVYEPQDWSSCENVAVHIKSYCHLQSPIPPSTSSSTFASTDQLKQQCQPKALKWLWFTSACLSEGALGMLVPPPSKLPRMLRKASSSSFNSSSFLSSSFSSSSSSFSSSFTEDRALIVNNNSLEKNTFSASYQCDGDEDEESEDDELNDQCLPTSTIKTSEKPHSDDSSSEDDQEVPVKGMDDGSTSNLKICQRKTMYYKCRNYEIGIFFRSNAHAVGEHAGVQYTTANHFSDVLSHEQVMNNKPHTFTEEEANDIRERSRNDKSDIRFISLPIPYQMPHASYVTDSSQHHQPYFHNEKDMGSYLSTRNWYQSTKATVSPLLQHPPPSPPAVTAVTIPVSFNPIDSSSPSCSPLSPVPSPTTKSNICKNSKQNQIVLTHRKELYTKSDRSKNIDRGGRVDENNPDLLGSTIDNTRLKRDTLSQLPLIQPSRTNSWKKVEPKKRRRKIRHTSLLSSDSSDCDN